MIIAKTIQSFLYLLRRMNLLLTFCSVLFLSMTVSTKADIIPEQFDTLIFLTSHSGFLYSSVLPLYVSKSFYKPSFAVISASSLVRLSFSSVRLFIPRCQTRPIGGGLQVPYVSSGGRGGIPLYFKEYFKL